MELSRDSIRREVDAFRKGFAEELIANAAKSIYLEKKGEVGVIYLDQVNEKANKLSTLNVLRFFELLQQVEDDRSIKSLVVISKKASIFIAGADIAEIQRFANGEATVDSLMKLQAVFTYLENLPIPTIAAIHGASMGGGTELALSCNYRMVTDAPETKIALPEVMLGIIPGWGGTQRMPRLIGLQKALDLILTGKNVDARKAKKMGLVDKVVPKEWLEEKAIAWATELGKKRKTEHPKTLTLQEKLLENVPGGKWIIFDQAKKAVLEKSKGNYPAPLAAIEVIRKTYGGDIEAGLKVEAEAFSELVKTSQCQNLIRIFYLNEKVKRDKGTDKGTPAVPVERAGVIGAGVMGGGIAQLFAAKDVRVRMKDVNWESMGKGFQAANKIFKKLVDRRKMKQSDVDNAMARIEGTTTYSGFTTLDLVVEAAVENMDLKKKIFQELEKVTSEKCVLATNTSSLSVTELASVTKEPGRVVGMHFFNPVEKMPLVEVIRGSKTSDEATATVFQFAKKLGKTPIVVKDAPGFVVNRILGPYLNEAAFLILDGVDIRDIDQILEKFGMPMGPVTLLDEVGLDVASKVSKVLYGAFGERMKPADMLDSIVAEGRLGKKTGKGIYLYPEGKKEMDPALLAKVQSKMRAVELTDDVVLKRCVYAMVNEGARVVEEGLVRDVSDVDVGMIFGTGFAPFRGGLLRYADSVGAESIVSDLEVLARNYGERFQPCSFLLSLANQKGKFYKN